MDEPRLAQIAEEIRKTLFVERLGGAPVGPGEQRDQAITQMSYYLRECGLNVQRPVPFGVGPKDLLTIKDLAIRMIGDQLRAGQRPHPASVWGPMGLAEGDWRDVEQGLIADGAIAPANRIGSEYRLPAASEVRYRELTMTKRQKVLRWLGPRTAALFWALIGVVLTLIVTDTYRRLFPA
jgi:hypothetical protein